MTPLEAPYLWFGGKSRCAETVWSRFGEVDAFSEPFYGTGAVLLAAPWSPGCRRFEAVNDIDAFVANFWRAVQAAPDAVAAACDWPANEVDLIARHKWLVEVSRKAAFCQRMLDDPDFYDVRTAAWWCWGICCWFGSGWCHGVWHGPGSGEKGFVKKPVAQHQGALRPNAWPVALDVAAAAAISAEMDQRREGMRLWFNALAARLRDVRVCCGDFARICTPSYTFERGDVAAVFLDPPYAQSTGRTMGMYRDDSGSVSFRARTWAIENGTNPRLRICLAGYDGEHAMPDNWQCVSWVAQGGFGNQGESNENRRRERLWFSPHCVVPDEARSLFDA